MAPDKTNKEVEARGMVDGGEDPPDNVEDLRQLEPPEPLERILQVTVSLRAGQVYGARLPHYPRLLIKHLEDRGMQWTIDDEEDGSVILRMSAPS